MDVGWIAIARNKGRCPSLPQDCTGHKRGAEFCRRQLVLPLHRRPHPTPPSSTWWPDLDSSEGSSGPQPPGPRRWAGAKSHPLAQKNQPPAPTPAAKPRAWMREASSHPQHTPGNASSLGVASKTSDTSAHLFLTLSTRQALCGPRPPPPRPPTRGRISSTTIEDLLDARSRFDMHKHQRPFQGGRQPQAISVYPINCNLLPTAI